MEVGIGLPSTIPGVDPQAILEWARRAEAKGFARDLSVISLTDTEQEQVLDRIRVDRQSRRGIYKPSREAIARDVVASERLEGVDARRWITREGR
jgi:hypothetical protein